MNLKILALQKALINSIVILLIKVIIDREYIFLFSFTRCRRIFHTVGLNDFKRIHIEVKFCCSRVMKFESTEPYSETSRVKLMNLTLVAIL